MTTMPRPPDLTPAEFNIMKVLWQLERATVAEVRAELNKKPGVDLAYTTVMTLLGRLAAKGAVAVDKDREPYVYAPAFRRESVLRDRLRSFLSDVFDGDSQAMVLGLVADESLSLDELRAIERDLGAERPRKKEKR
ncbi:MAG: BlaI/MecI/CopY family transcriptional regulator [Myxococcales bacterium]|nr:BlaI/MecI/CopY family transcriptional regulator [Myxococcales bacterium]MBK7196010.1 BlaI/MecI/CopY family transcriptional regulator [Myxococcales bacterium]MBP6844612.1 BlaI/MecI/CopY family transcriptional regulator [Kofleriaceae bacterium]